MDANEIRVECAKIAKDIVIGLGGNLNFPGKSIEDNTKLVEEIFNKIFDCVVEKVG